MFSVTKMKLLSGGTLVKSFKLFENILILSLSPPPKKDEKITVYIKEKKKKKQR